MAQSRRPRLTRRTVEGLELVLLLEFRLRQDEEKHLNGGSRLGGRAEDPLVEGVGGVDVVPLLLSETLRPEERALLDRGELELEGPLLSRLLELGGHLFEVPALLLGDPCGLTFQTLLSLSDVRIADSLTRATRCFLAPPCKDGRRGPWLKSLAPRGCAR